MAENSVVLDKIHNPTRRGRRILVLLLATAAALGFWFGRSSPAAPAELYIAPEDLAFGHIWETVDLRRSVTIHNRTNRDIHIQRFASNCSCLSVASKSVNIRAGDSAGVPLTLNLRQPRFKHSGKGEWTPFTLSLVAVLNDGVPNASHWTISGHVRVPFVFESPAVNFGELLPGRQPLPRTITFIQDSELTNVSLDYDRKALDVRLKVNPTKPRTWHMQIAPGSDLEPGFHERAVKVCGTTRGGQQASGACYVRFFCLPDIYAIPSVVLAGPRAVGEVMTETITIASHTGRPVEILSMTCDSSAVRIRRKGLTAFSLSAAVGELGPHSHNVKVSVRRREEERVVTVVIPVHGHGLAASQAKVAANIAGRREP